MKNWMKFFWSRKNVKEKHIESYHPRERYQADIIFLPNYVWYRFKYNLTMIDHFTKNGWVISLNDKKAEIIL